MDHDNDTDDSLFGIYFGKAKWPVVSLLIAITVVIGAYTINANNNASHVRGQIIQACASSTDQPTCAKNLTTAVNAVHQ